MTKIFLICYTCIKYVKRDKKWTLIEDETNQTF